MITNKQKKMNSGTKEAVECYFQEKEKRTHDVIDPLKQKQIHHRYHKEEKTQLSHGATYVSC